MKAIYKKIGILNFLAIKNFYNNCVGKNDFYNMINRRLKYKKPSELANFLINEFQIHCKDFAKY
jgi:hypothetical protein